MEANELNGKNLMVGDWVVYEGDTNYDNPIRIEGMDIATKSLITSDREDVGFDGIEPIPLTAEILEKNGFVNSGGLWHLSGEDMGLMQGCTSFQAFAYYADPRYCFCEIAYLHELQHALRLCGIDKEIVL